MADASSSPWNENASDCPATAWKRLAERRARAERHEQVEPQHRRRQHQRHGDERFDQQLAAKLADGQQAAQPDAERQQHRDRAEAQPQRDAECCPIHSARYCGTAKPYGRRIARALPPWHVLIEALGDRRARFSKHHALPERRMERFRQQRVACHGCEAGVKHQRIGQDASGRVAGRGELRRLRDVVAEHKHRLKRLPEAPGLRSAASAAWPYGAYVGIRDREPLDPAACSSVRPGRPGARPPPAATHAERTERSGRRA